MIKAVFFDAIKTLFAPFPDEVTLYQNVITKITGIEISKEKLWPILDQAMKETEALDAVKENSLQQWSYYPEKVAELIGCAKEDCREVGEKLRYETWGNFHNYRLYDDVLPAIKMACNRGLYIACVSNEDGWLHSFFEHFNIEKDFSYTLTSDEAGIEKPNPKIFEKALSETGFSPDEVLFIGDSLISDYQGASRVGMKALLIDRKNQIEDDGIARITKLTEFEEYL